MIQQRWFRNPVNSPVEVGSLSHLHGLIHPRCRISSINSTMIQQRSRVSFSQPKKEWSKIDLRQHVLCEQETWEPKYSGQIIIFHQPWFPWNKGISLPQLPFGVRSCEVAIIWPEIFQPFQTCSKKCPLQPNETRPTTTCTSPPQPPQPQRPPKKRPGTLNPKRRKSMALCGIASTYRWLLGTIHQDVGCLPPPN